MKNLNREIDYWWACFRCGHYKRVEESELDSLELSTTNECPICKELGYVNVQIPLDVMNDQYIKEHYED